MKYALHVGLWTAGLAGMGAASFGEWRAYFEALAVMGGCAAALVMGYDWGKDDRF